MAVTVKDAVLSLLRRGMITRAEAARLAGVSRPTVTRWSRDIRVEDIRARRINRWLGEAMMKQRQRVHQNEPFYQNLNPKA